MEKFDDVYQLERFSKTKEEFEFYYDNDLKEKVDRLESERQKTIDLAKNKGKKLILPFTGVILMYIFLKDYAIYGVGAFIFYAGYLFKDIKSRRRDLKYKIKEEIITDLVRFMNENFTYQPRKYLYSRHFINANIFKNKPNRYTGDDLITGYVGGESETTKDMDEKPPKTDLSFSEIKADSVERYKDKDGKTRERVHTIFQGLFFKADFNKDFDGLTIVVPKTRSSSWFSFFKKEKENRLQEVELENIDFMDKFTVRTTDQVLARYILTPGFMNRLLDFSNRESESNEDENFEQPQSIKEAFQMGLSQAETSNDAYTDTPYFSFRDGTMYFMLPTRKEHFEFNILVPLNKRVIYSYFKDINLALELVDELNLNLRIWTKE